MFIYQEEGLPSQFYASPRGHQPTIASTNVQRDEISNVQPARNTTEGRSAFGGSQSASISASTNFNRIVEGVEKLVESDTYEAPPAMPQLPEFLRPTQPSSNVPYQTPMVPPGFGLQAPARSPTFAPFFTSSSIWSPSPPSLSHDVSQHRLDNTQALGPSSQISRGQDPYTLDTPSPSLAAFQSELSLQQKEMDGRSSTQFASTWTPQSISTPNRSFGVDLNLTACLRTVLLCFSIRSSHLQATISRLRIIMLLLLLPCLRLMRLIAGKVLKILLLVLVLLDSKRLPADRRVEISSV